MSYKWKPSSTQKRAFAERMRDPLEKAAYIERKEAKSTKRRAGSQFDCQSAGGSYVPTKHQYETAIEILGARDISKELQSAASIVMSGWSCQDKVHHDYIHLVNEWYRSNIKN